VSKLPNFVPVSQNSKVTEDDLPNSDAAYECVSASLLMAVMQQLEITAEGGTFTCDYFKDEVYGEAYQGGTSAIKYVPLVASLGCTLAPINGTPGQLVSAIHNALDKGIPVIVTIPDTYVPASYGWTHVCCCYADSASTITMLDPFPVPHGVSRTYDDSQWIDLLQDNQIWTVEKLQKVEEEIVIIAITDPEVARYFELANTDGSQWRCRSTGKIIQFGLLDAYRAYGNSALCGLTYLGLPQSNEIPLTGIPGAVKQYFERGTLIYDPAHKNDDPPGASAVYPAHLYTGPAQDPRVAQIAPLQGQLAALQAQIAQAQAGNPALQQQLDAANAKALKAIADLQA
jgi:hypothetical protein